jgi:LacI family transcriptional regulator
VAAPTIRKIAEQTGVSAATVSLALRGVGRMSPKTRERIEQVAKTLGYQPHPLLARAFSLARRPEVLHYRESLAFIIEWEISTGPEFQKIIHAAASERATRMGYKLETFVLSGKPSDHRRLSRILIARGIRGVIVIPRLEHIYPRIYLEWKELAAVEIGRTLWSPRNLHHVETGDYHKIIEALHLLKKVGYRRIGMAVEPMQNMHQRGIYNAAYLLQQLRLPVRQRIPPLSTYGEWNEKTFQRWMRQYRPDVLYIHDTKRVLPWLQNMGLSVPKDISLFCANVEHPQFSGLRRNYDAIGRSAVEMLSLLLENESLGLSDTPRCWQVDESFQAGSTLSRPIEKYISKAGSLLPANYWQPAKGNVMV